MAIYWGTRDETSGTIDADGTIGEIECRWREPLCQGVDCYYCGEVVAFPAVHWSGSGDDIYLHPQCACLWAIKLLDDYEIVHKGRAAWLKRQEDFRRYNARLREAEEAMQCSRRTIQQLEFAVAAGNGMRSQLDQERRALEVALKHKPELSDTIPVRLDPQRLFSNKQKHEIYLRADGLCGICGRDPGKIWHADHIHPHSRGGKTEVVNGQLLCGGCNSRKSAKVLTVDGG